MAANKKRFKDLAHKFSPERADQIRSEALAEIDAAGYGALRRARALTQVELADKLNISQASVAALESRADLHLSTLAKYIRALGGELEIRAVFPNATFNLEPPAIPAPRSAVRRARVKA